MKTILLSALLLSTFCGVDDCKPQPPETVSEADPYRLSYIVDHRTGLCFAKYQANVGNPGIALVPCDKLGKIAPTAVENYK